MNYNRTSICLIVFLLATIVMVPIVSAEQNMDPANSQVLSKKQESSVDMAYKAKIENYVNNRANQEIPVDEWLEVIDPAYYKNLTLKQKSDYHKMTTKIPDLNQASSISENAEIKSVFGTRNKNSKAIQVMDVVIPIFGTFGGNTAATFGVVTYHGYSATEEYFPEQNVAMELFYMPAGSSSWQYVNSASNRETYVRYIDVDGYKFLPSAGTYRSFVAVYGICPPDSINPTYYYSTYTNTVQYT